MARLPEGMCRLPKKWGYPIFSSKDDRFRIEIHDNLGIPHGKKSQEIRRGNVQKPEEQLGFTYDVVGKL